MMPVCLNHKINMSLVVLTALAASGLRSQASTINLYSEWSIITSGDLENVSDFYGNAYVGGNVTVQNSFDAAINDKDTMPAGNVSLAVAGNIDGGGAIQVNAGNVVVGGSILAGRTINMNSLGTVSQGNSSLLPSSPVAQAVADSLYWSTLAANSTVTVKNNQLTFNCAQNASLAVFNITASQLLGTANQSIALSTAAGTGQILINVSGANASELSSVNFLSSFQNWGTNITFNFYQATNVSFSTETYGYVVAPDATVSSDAPIVGGVMCETLDTSSEVEMGGTPNYVGGASVPDGGATVALLGLSISSAALIRRKYFRA
jgi:choice-of-anchor A domain-containing protein